MSTRSSIWSLNQMIADPIAKLVLIVLADAADRFGVSWYSQSKLAEKCGHIHVNSIAAKLHDLEVDGFIKRFPRITRGGRRSDVTVIAFRDDLEEASVAPKTRDERLKILENLVLPQQHKMTIILHDQEPLLGLDDTTSQPTPRVGCGPTPRVGCGPTPRVGPTKEEPINKKNLIIRETRIDDAFDEFWSFVPRKTAKAAARKSYEKALKRVASGTILQAMKDYASHLRCNGTESRFILHAATWLNGARWEDELRPSVTPQSELMTALDEIDSAIQFGGLDSGGDDR
jgi:hypothetical protein